MLVVVVVLLDPFCLNAEYKGREGMKEPLYLQQLPTDDSPLIAARFRTTHL